MAWVKTSTMAACRRFTRSGRNLAPIGQRMNARAEQRLIGIDVAHAAHEVLIEQHAT